VFLTTLLAACRSKTAGNNAESKIRMTTSASIGCRGIDDRQTAAYGDYVGADYSSMRYGYRNRASGFNFNRLDNYGFSDPRALGERPR
jgi:hypothetical protein